MTAHVLIADDEPDIREILAFKLRSKGFTVTAVADGAACLSQLAESEALPDMVLLDVMMPRVDGFRVLREVRETYDPALPVIMLTSRGQEPDTVRGLENGATDYVRKPFSPDELVARMRRHL